MLSSGASRRCLAAAARMRSRLASESERALRGTGRSRDRSGTSRRQRLGCGVRHRTSPTHFRDLHAANWAEVAESRVQERRNQQWSRVFRKRLRRRRRTVWARRATRFASRSTSARPRRASGSARPPAMSAAWRRSCASRARTRRRRYAEQAADRAERAGKWLHESDGDRILRDVEDFGRSNPWAVVAGGLALGFAASRLLKASSSERYQSSLGEQRSRTCRRATASRARTVRPPVRGHPRRPPMHAEARRALAMATDQQSGPARAADRASS